MRALPVAVVDVAATWRTSSRSVARFKLGLISQRNLDDMSDMR